MCSCIYGVEGSMCNSNGSSGVAVAVERSIYLTRPPVLRSTGPTASAPDGDVPRPVRRRSRPPARHGAHRRYHATATDIDPVCHLIRMCKYSPASYLINFVTSQRNQFPRISHQQENRQKKTIMERRYGANIVSVSCASCLDACPYPHRFHCHYYRKNYQ